MYLGQGGEGLSLGSGELLGTWMVVPGSEQRTWEKETPWLLSRPSPGRRDTSWVSAGKLKQRMVWCGLLCSARCDPSGGAAPRS